MTGTVQKTEERNEIQKSVGRLAAAADTGCVTCSLMQMNIHTSLLGEMSDML